MKAKHQSPTETAPSTPMHNHTQTDTAANMLLPVGTKFNDIYMDASDVAFELKISKRLVRNMRVSGKLSYTNPFGKIWYLRQEIAEILEANKKMRRT